MFNMFFSIWKYDKLYQSAQIWPVGIALLTILWYILSSNIFKNYHLTQYSPFFKVKKS